MAQDNIEVEIKVKISKDRFEKIKARVQKTAKFIKKTRQIDYYYNLLPKNFLKPEYPYEWLSIRDRGGKLLLNYKYWYPPGAKHTTHCDEYETEIGDKEQLDRIFKALNITEIVKVDKTRRTYVYKNKIEIAMDKVVGLGYFIEAEALKNEGGIDKTYEKLAEFLKSLGVRKIVTVPGGYALAMMKKKGLI
jgi:predicted adenylyl cyclase CyaB